MNNKNDNKKGQILNFGIGLEDGLIVSKLKPVQISVEKPKTKPVPVPNPKVEK